MSSSTATNTTAGSTQVAILAFEGISPFHLSVPCMVFNEAARAAGIDSFRVQVCSEQGAAINAATGFQIQPQFGLEAIEQADVVIIPSWTSAAESPSPALLQALQQAHQNGAQIVGLCIGAYVLAYAGLLDDHQATTHWAYVDDFQQRFPRVELQPDVLYLQQGNLVTSAGTAAAIDCCLQLIRDSHGGELANRVARMMVVAPHRSGGQAQFIELPLPQQIRDQKLAELLDDVRANLAGHYSIDTLAERLAMSRRTFTRHFQALTGQSFGEWLLQQRLRYCQQLLESSALTIELIAERCGFNSVVTLRHHFRQQFKVSPGQWRKAFKVG
ncbi:GlxA family transcriptional regulator [Bacterioplanoides sp.]|uniref:GlxA family transcriptional regulator n=1 Tax=Bacterioplanoides sp. TaxID=2066072 RepID=UPI003B592ACC